jgi:hypothetical protein
VPSARIFRLFFHLKTCRLAANFEDFGTIFEITNWFCEKQFGSWNSILLIARKTYAWRIYAPIKCGEMFLRANVFRAIVLWAIVFRPIVSACKKPSEKMSSGQMSPCKCHRTIFLNANVRYSNQVYKRLLVHDWSENSFRSPLFWCFLPYQTDRPDEAAGLAGNQFFLQSLQHISIYTKKTFDDFGDISSTPSVLAFRAFRICSSTKQSNFQLKKKHVLKNCVKTAFLLVQIFHPSAIVFDEFSFCITKFVFFIFLFCSFQTFIYTINQKKSLNTNREDNVFHNKPINVTFHRNDVSFFFRNHYNRDS